MAGSFAKRFAAGRGVHGPLVPGADPHRQVLAAWGLSDDAGGLERFTDIVLAAAEGRAWDRRAAAERGIPLPAVTRRGAA